MQVEFTKELSTEMQAVADCREAVKKAEAEVEKCKGELKVAKSLLESANEDLNEAVDAAIEAERQPTLFSGIGDDLSDAADSERPPRTVESEPAVGGDAGAGVDAILAVQGDLIDLTVETPVLALPPASGSTDAEAAESEPEQTGQPSAAPAAWRRLSLDEAFETEVDISTEVISAIKIRGVITVGNLADLLLAGHTFDLKLIDVQAVCESIELMSADDPHPVKFSEDEGADGVPVPFSINEDGDAVPAQTLLDTVPVPADEEKPKGKGRGGRRKKSAESEAA